MLRSAVVFFRLLLEQRQLIVSMAMREVKSKYIGSLLGFVWTFLRPLVMITVFWFVFSVGFRSRPMQDVPFVVWLTAGMAPWFVFSDIVLRSTSVILGNANLIKKTLFYPQILPVIKVVSASVTHFAFLLLLLGLIIFQGLDINLWFLQFCYYFFAMCILALGISWMSSALNVFIRDVEQIMGVIIQVGFWATPIFWDIKMMPERVQLYLKLNPMFYIVQGYRDSFISFVPFWDHPLLTVYFWGVVLFLFFSGALVFQKLRPQFADVL
ncbi:MAG: ABC transporter permease [Bacteroidetes bacterium]|nr:ABC transporter permease [Bacteroidota bacterium]